ncbi:unnamed protein product [Peronospora farinosa]|uniref:CCHC-type domain-containing protein n=1 Tax=Peronospora farinosa TaxID=134698 RepID=A0AAV0SQQ5_9STRA|nr:unnamed protein product [Peronospora farinosa]
MVRVPGSSEDAGFHRESHEEEKTSVKIDQGTTKTLETGSPVIKREEGSEDLQSPGRSSAIEVKVEYEEKPQSPLPYVFVEEDNMGHNKYYGPGVPSLTAKAKKQGTPKKVSQPTTQEPKVPKNKQKKQKHTKLKAPRGGDTKDESGESQGVASKDWTEENLEEAYHRNKLKKFLRKDPVMKALKVKLLDQVHGPITALPTTTTDLEVLKAVMNMLHEAGMDAGNFTAETLFDFGFETLKKTLVTLHGHLKTLVGEFLPKEVPRQDGGVVDPGVGSPSASLGESSPRSQYESATSSMMSALMDTVDRMQLGPAGAALLEARIRETGHMDTATPWVQRQAQEETEARCKVEPSALQSYFDKAMTKFLEEQGSTKDAVDRGYTTKGQGPVHPRSSQRIERLRPLGDIPDVDMESVGSTHDEYDPDDLTFPMISARATVAAATAGGPPTVVPHIRVSASSDLKEFSGRDHDEDRARSWSTKVKTAFLRDQAPDSEKCLIFGSLLTGPAHNWYRQLGRTVRVDWKLLLREFQAQLCGLGVAKLDIKGGPPSVKREHVDHYVETLDDRELADQLTLLRLFYADDLEEVLLARQRAKTRQKRILFGSSKFRQKAPTTPDHTKSQLRRPVQVIRATSESENDQGSSSSGSEGEGDLRRIYAAASKPYTGRARNADDPRDHQDPDPDRGRRMAEGPGQKVVPWSPVTKCTHCGSRKHVDLECWKRLVCECCGKKGHPADHCLSVCRGCGKVHDVGKCPMEEFYNLIRQ